jgi:hypothetical protein
MIHYVFWRFLRSRWKRMSMGYRPLGWTISEPAVNFRCYGAAGTHLAEARSLFIRRLLGTV